MLSTEQKTVIRAFEQGFSDKKDQKIILYGVGINTKAVLEETSGFSFAGLMDATSEGQVKYGLPVYSATEVSQMQAKPLIAIIARQSVVNIIYKRIAWLYDENGIEINKDSIKNAELNKKLNNIKSINFICGDASNIKEKYDTIIVDPPRAGLSKKVIDKILEIKPEKIIYTSCNPNTLKRDIKLLECNYSVKEITPVNMFPKTEHIECVALLIHK